MIQKPIKVSHTIDEQIKEKRHKNLQQSMSQKVVKHKIVAATSLFFKYYVNYRYHCDNVKHEFPLLKILSKQPQKNGHITV